MPSITLPFDPAVGPIITFGISPPSSLAQAGSPAPSIKYIKGLVDTGCSNVSVNKATAVGAGLAIVGKAPVVSTTQAVNADVFLGDIHLPYTVRGATSHITFKDVRFLDLILPNASFDALIGRDVLGIGTLFFNGAANQFTISW